MDCQCKVLTGAAGHFGSLDLVVKGSPQTGPNLCSLKKTYSIVYLFLPSLSSQAAGLVLLRYLFLSKVKKSLGDVEGGL